MLLELVFYSIGAVIVYNILLYLHHIWTLRRYPPGPFPLPVIGNLNLLDPNKPHEIFAILGKKYGDVLSISFGMERIVVVNTIEPAREAVIEKASDFSGRPLNNFYFNAVSRNHADLIFSDYSSGWHEKRILVSKALKVFGDQESSLEETIVNEVKKCSKRLEQHSAIPIDLENELKFAIYSIISQIVFGFECSSDLNDENFQTCITAIKDLEEAIRNDPTPVFPWLKYFPILTIRLMKKGFKSLNAFLSKHYELNEQRLLTNKPTNFLSWLIKVSKDEEMLQTYGYKTPLSRDNVETLASDMLFASCDATTSNLMWAFLNLLHHPNILEELSLEIQNVVGDQKYPTLKDRQLMPKVQAFLQECVRVAVSPLSLPRRTTADSSIGGNPLRKNTLVVFNIWSIHHDQRHWEDPFEFKPTRWLDNDGKFNPRKHRSYIPFFMGKRSCIGEQIGRNILFLLVTRIIADFKIDQEPNVKLPKLTDGIMTLTLAPLPFKVILTKN